MDHDQAKNLVFCSMAASSLASMIGNGTGHPLDTIKIRIQLADRPISMRACAVDLVTKEGFSSLFKGISQPIIATTPVLVSGISTTEYSRR